MTPPFCAERLARISVLIISCVSSGGNGGCLVSTILRACALPTLLLAILTITGMILLRLTERKVVLLDTDHLWGIGGDPAWVWKAFTRGYNPLFMDPYDSGYTAGGLTGLKLKDVGKIDPRWEPVRKATGYTHMLAEKMNLSEIILHPELTQTGYCLANPGTEYLVYIPRECPLTIWVNLSNARGNLRVEWFNPSTGETADDGMVAGGDMQVFSAPFREDAVLILRSI
ncbi:MAG: putative collagen-binding domain-containing protein [Thermoproteota archaeon]